MTNRAPQEILREVAANIDRLDGVIFGGALAIVPPEGGEPLTLILTPGKADAAFFWSQVAMLVKVTMDNLDTQTDVYGRR